MAKPPQRPRYTPPPKKPEPKHEPEPVAAQPVLEPQPQAPQEAPAAPEPVAETPPPAQATTNPAQPPPSYRAVPFHAPMSEDRRRFLLGTLRGVPPPSEPSHEVSELLEDGYIAECDGKLDLTAKGREYMGVV